MKKRIAILLAVVLVANGVGSFSHVEASTDNKVHVDFTTGYWHIADGDLVVSVTHDPENPLEGSYKEATSGIENTDDGSDESVVDPVLTFTPAPGKDVEVDRKYLISESPYTWELPTRGENEGLRCFAKTTNTESFTFTPGYSIERRLDKIEFATNGTQQLDISTLVEEEMEHLHILVRIIDDGLVDASITDVTGDGDLRHWPADPQTVGIRIDSPVIGTTYSQTVYIDVELKPGVSSTSFKPRIQASALNPASSGEVVGTSVSSGIMELGTWEWTTTDSNWWDWRKGEGVIKGVLFPEVQWNTPAGDNVEVSVDNITVTFSEVTAGGDTALTTAADGPPIPTLFKLGKPPTYFDITTTAVYNPPISVCIDYSSMQFKNENELRLWQWNGSDWVDSTTSVDTENNVICGQTDSLSIFTIVEPNLLPVVQISADQFLAPVDSIFTFDGSASYDPDGIITSYEWDFGDGNSSSGNMTTHSYSTSGIYNVTLTVTDDIGAQSIDTAIIIVCDLPVVQISADQYLAPVDSIFTFDGSASYDPDGIITSYEWDFGDGNSSSGNITTHSYSTSGVYNVTLTVTDDIGAQSTDTAIIVVYDTDAGFATGGGWIVPGGKTSYEDDWLPNIDDISPANFGFVVKYKPGASTPDGQLEFQYRQGDFNLHSDGMEWLLVNDNWAKFHGTATIKGMDGLFPFGVDARDGDYGGVDKPDKFIIKIWAPGTDPDKDEPIYKASGELEGGNIVIHTK